MVITRKSIKSNIALLWLIVLVLPALLLTAGIDEVGAEPLVDQSSSNPATPTQKVNAAAVVSGADSVSVFSNFDPDNDKLLEVAGRLKVTDSDPGQGYFRTSVRSGLVGRLFINLFGQWYYAADMSHAAIQGLTQSESIVDSIPISTIDGTQHNVVVTILGVNSPAVIGGEMTGSVTEDVDPDGDNLLETHGKLTITDADAGESYFKTALTAGTYGWLFINSWGSWSYVVDNRTAAVQDLTGAGSHVDTVTVSSLDGTTQDIVITITGVDETPPNQVSWTAPVQREDGSPIPLAEIAGYRVYYGRSHGDYTRVVQVEGSATTNITLDGLASGTYYFVVTAVDQHGRESLFSREITRRIVAM